MWNREFPGKDEDFRVAGAVFQRGEDPGSGGKGVLLWKTGKTLREDGFTRWRRRAGSNRRIKVLQTSALPLGYAAALCFEGPCERNEGKF